MKPCTFQSMIEKLKKKSTPRKFLILQETETPKKCLHFLKRKLFLYLRKRKRRNGNSKKASYISGGNLQSPKNKQKVLTTQFNHLASLAKWLSVRL